MIFNKLLGYQFKSGMADFIPKLIGALGLPPHKIEWGSGPAINTLSRIVYLPCPADDVILPAGMVRRFAGYIVHELLHAKWTEQITEESAASRLYGNAYLNHLRNALEDARIERKAIAEKLLGNATDLLHSLSQLLVDDAKGIDWTDPNQYPFSIAIYARGFVKIPVPSNLVPIWDEAKRRVSVAQSNHDSLAIAEWVYDQLKRLNDKPKDQPKDNPQDKPKDQPQDNPQDKPQDKQQGDQQQDQQPQENGKRDQQGGDQSQDKGDQQGKPLTDQQGVSAEPQAPQIDNTGFDYQPRPDIEAHQTDEVRWTFKPTSGKFAYELRRLFDNSAREEFEGFRKSGTLNPGALGRSDDRIFFRRREIGGVDSALAIVLDISSSMSVGGRNAAAAQAAASIVDTLGVNVAIGLVTFNASVTIQCPIGTPPAKIKSSLSRIKTFGGTSDAAAMRVAIDLMLKRTETRRVIFVITDGEGNKYATRKQVQAAEAIGIRVVAIGLGYDVSGIYPNSVTIHSASQLGAVSFKQLKDAA